MKKKLLIHLNFLERMALNYLFIENYFKQFSFN